MPDSKIDHLGKVRMFSALNKKELRLIARASDEIQVPAGSEIVRQGTSGREFFLIRSGEATVRRDGRKVASLGPGSYFGEMALLDRGPRSATIVAETPCDLVVIGQREFMGLLDEVPAVAHKLLVTMAARLREADARALSH